MVGGSEEASDNGTEKEQEPKLNEQDLVKIFEMTSGFAIEETEPIVYYEDYFDCNGVEDEEDESYDDSNFFEEEKEKKPKKERKPKEAKEKKEKKPKEKKEKRKREKKAAPVTDKNGYTFTLRKKLK